MPKKFISLLIVGIVCMSCCSTALASEHDNNGYVSDMTNNTVTYLFAEGQGETYTGIGNINTQTDTRTLEQKEDDANQARIDELAKLVDEAANQLNEGSAQIGTEFNKAFTDYSFTPIDQNYTLKPFADIQLPDYTLPNWQLPPLPELPPLPDWLNLQLTYPDIIFQNVDAEKVIPQPTWVPVENGYAIVEQVKVPIVQIQTLLQIENKLHDQTADLNIVPQLPTYVMDMEELKGLIDEYYKLQLDQDMLNWFNQMLQSWQISGTQLPGVGGLINNPNPGALNQYFNDTLNIQPIGDMQVSVPTRYDVLYARLMEYLLELQRLGQTTIQINRITIYNVQNYNYRCIRHATPYNDYRWQVSGPSGSVETHTETNYLKILFQSAGTYDVDVFNVQSVTRNNQVSGKKATIWTMGQGDVFDGLVLYNHTTTFKSFVADDIGPVVEEVRLVDDSFTANVTQQMLNKIQMIDSNGNIHTTADGFTTERH